MTVVQKPPSTPATMLKISHPATVGLYFYYNVAATGDKRTVHTPRRTTNVRHPMAPISFL